MSQSEIATQWGLPESFEPVRYAIPDEVKEVVRELLQPDEPVLVTISNEGDSLHLVATTQRLLSIKSGGATAGVTGFNVKEFPWLGITNLVLQDAALNKKIAVHYRSNDGRTVELGRRAKMAKAASDNLMPFESEAGRQAFEAISAVWQHKVDEAGGLEII